MRRSTVSSRRPLVLRCGAVTLGGALLALGLGIASCTQDFDQFSVDESATSSGGAAGSTATGGAGGSTAGSAQGGSSSGGDSGSDVSTGGTAGTTSGGSAGVGGVGGSAGAGGTAGAAGDGGGDVDCGADLKLCDGECVPDDDPATGCGGDSCDPCGDSNGTVSCSLSNACAIVCDSGFANCNGDTADGCEANLDEDINNCGSCGGVCMVPNATAACVAEECEVDQCDPGWEDCDGDPTTGCETNTDGDPTACGSCTNDCTAQAGDWICNSGSCESSMCPTGFGNCEGNGCITNLNTSSSHCGFCGNSCSDLPNAVGTCQSGTCEVVTCIGNFADCDGLAVNGCERNLDEDVDHCGACDRACSDAGVASKSCNAGVCTSQCNADVGNCTQPTAPTADDGCETSLLDDEDNCGACARACSGGNVAQRACTAGVCTSSCDADWGNCQTPDGSGPDDGCETSITSDTSHCGACGRACSMNGAALLACSGGLCTPSCQSNRADCSQPSAPAPDDGCETNTATDSDNCGSCGRACSLTNASATSCNGGSCFPSCEAGALNCVTPPAGFPDDGCETDPDTDVDHCGACNRACGFANVASRSCAGGLCNSTCSGSFDNCSTPAAPANDNGCETNVAIDAANCGGCGQACSTVNSTNQTCSGGTCNHQCSGTFRDCNGALPGASDDGCEVDIDSDPDNCGACARACSGAGVEAIICSAGTCASSCDPGFGNCSTPSAPTPDDGCETNVGSSQSNCGGCGNNCGAQNGLVCGNNTTGICDCGGSNGRCDTSGGAGECKGSGLCECDRVGEDVLCRPGEYCVDDSGAFQNRCSCNGGAACTSSQVCCEDAGCTNINTSASHCGACNHPCAPGFVCDGGSCECNGNGDCNGGSAGTCTGGLCQCAGGSCGNGERCLPDGSCG